MLMGFTDAREYLLYGDWRDYVNAGEPLTEDEKTKLDDALIAVDMRLDHLEGLLEEKFI